ncbi:MAG: hypothetical protein M9883_04290 [Methylobacteriaceae bacterium]|nr:hypothetical protein [Methylobacteriaceae bacterium]
MFDSAVGDVGAECRESEDFDMELGCAAALGAGMIAVSHGRTLFRG